MTDDPARPTLRLYNTLARAKEEFRPIDPGNVRMYVCGPTVYDFAHIGNARPAIVFDLLFRLLRHLYGQASVTYVRNITDVDDRINARAARDFPDLPLNDAIRRVTTETERQYLEDIRALGVLMPEDVNSPGERPRLLQPRATEHIDEMRVLIDRLVRSGHAYVAEEHVLFDVPSMPDYGGLSRRPLDEMEAGARVDVAPYKRSPLDFVLWKPSKPGEPAWPSPAGIAPPGRPGWHIECSAMSWKHLGERFDIHAGGLDLIFPHHENEIAQTRCCFGTPAMADVWMHNGFLQVEGAKMSKSLGNFVTIRDVLCDWPGEVVRLNMLKTHYRQPIDWTVRGLEESERTLKDWSALAAPFFHGVVENLTYLPERPLYPPLREALCDDLNTPRAISEIHHLRNQIVHDTGHTNVTAFTDSMRLLGFLRDPYSLVADLSVERKQEVETWVAARYQARAAKNWAESDRIRDELKAMGVQLKDNKDGTTTWEVVR